MHFAIVEDLKIDQNHLIHLIQENLEKHGETAHFDCYESGEAFLEAFRPGLFNAVFMDIMLDRNGRNGIDTALELRKSAQRLPIVFTTSERDYSLQGYRAHPLDYLLKPVEEKALASMRSGHFSPRLPTSKFRRRSDGDRHPRNGFCLMIFCMRRRRTTG